MKPIYKLTVLSLIIFSICFGSSFLRDLWEPDEPRFALVAKEMIASGNYVMPHRNKHPYPDKPPFFFWTIAASSLITGGINSQAAILPVAMAMVLSVFLVFLIARRLTEDDIVSFWAAVIFATSSKVFWQGSHAQIDMVLSALVYGAFYCFLLFLNSGKIRHSVFAYILMGLATLAKGPVGFIIPLGSIVTYKLIKKESIKDIFNLKAVLSFFAVVGTWLGLLITISITSGNMDYLNNILFKQTVVRYAKSWHHHQPFYYFLQVIIYDFFPWSFFLIGYFIKKIKEKQLFKENLFAVSWFLFTIVFFSIPSGKRGLYILPLYPAASILVAVYFSELKDKSLFKSIPSLLISFIYIALGTASIILSKKITSYEGLGLNGFPLALLIVFGILMIYKRHKPQYIIPIAQIFLFSFIAWVVFPKIDSVNSARTFIQENIKIMGPDATLAMAQYRSVHVLYGDRNVVEFGGIEEMDTINEFIDYLKNTPNSYGIVKEDHIDELLNKYENLHVCNERKVGSKKLYLLNYMRGEKKWKPDNLP